MKPEIIVDPGWAGRHNADPGSASRILRGQTYKNLSTVCVIPTRGLIPAKVVQCWMAMLAPMNQKFLRIFVIGMEVGAAYSQAVEMILNHPELKDWKFLLTLEEDNMPPPDGLLKLYESIDGHDVVGGLYWTKGEGGQPMIYGDPRAIPLSFAPQPPLPDSVQPANGLGMGFTLFRLKLFKDGRIPKPWFKTQQEVVPGAGVRVYTQDLYFFENIHRLGYKAACDTRVKVGHYDVERDIIW